jgi:hypothetical protein
LRLQLCVFIATKIRAESFGALALRPNQTGTIKNGMQLPRNAQIWLPGYISSLRRPKFDPKPVRVFVTIADHFEPMRGGADLNRGLERVGHWRKIWPEVAQRHRDARGKSAQYTFFYPEEEYRPEILEPLAEMVHAGFGDVEIHLHHDGEGEQNFVDRISGFKEALFHRHGLLRKDNSGRIIFGFIHGNWALDNSHPDGRWCGLNNEITLLRDLGCYADFTMPSAPSPTQARQVNTVYWAVDDPAKPKSYDSGLPASLPGSNSGPKGDLLMLPGPLALNWKQRSRGVAPRLEVGELAAHNPVTPERVRLWLDHAPRMGNDILVKLFAHGAWEANTAALLPRDLDRVFSLLESATADRGWQLHFSTAAELTDVALSREGLSFDS